MNTEVCVRNEMLFEHEAHSRRVVESTALEGQFRQALAQTARGGRAHSNVIEALRATRRRLNELVSRAKNWPLQPLVE